MINKRAQAFFIFFMIGLTIIVVAMGVSGAVKGGVDDARAPGQLDCANTSISDIDKAACVTSDISIFYVIGGFIAIGGLVIGIGRVL